MEITPQSLWDKNSDISWQWHLNFIGQYMQHCYYLYYIIDDIIQNNPQIKSIVELGTGYGALTIVLGLWGIKLNIPIITVDNKPEKIAPIKSILNTLKVNILSIDQFSPEAEKALLEFIGNNSTYFICDGADKDWEFNKFVPLLPDKSVISCHDWLTECKPEEIKQIAEKYCKPYKPEEWTKLNVQYATFIKKEESLIIVEESFLAQNKALDINNK